MRMPWKRAVSRALPSHRRVDHPAAAGERAFLQRREHAHRKKHGAAPVVAYEVQRWHGWLVRAAYGVQCAAQRDVVEVVAGGLRQAPRLPPTGHAPVDEPRIAFQAHVGAQAQAFHHAGPEAFDEDVARHGQPEGGLGAGRRTQVQRHAPAAAGRHIRGTASRTGAHDLDHLGAEVGRHHAAKGHRPDAAGAEDPDAGERTAHGKSLASGTVAMLGGRRAAGIVRCDEIAALRGGAPRFVGFDGSAGMGRA
jgi:hypothetical protein